MICRLFFPLKSSSLSINQYYVIYMKHHTIVFKVSKSGYDFARLTPVGVAFFACFREPSSKEYIRDFGDEIYDFN